MFIFCLQLDFELSQETLAEISYFERIAFGFPTNAMRRPNRKKQQKFADRVKIGRTAPVCFFACLFPTIGMEDPMRALR